MAQHNYHTLDEDTVGYEKGSVLKDVTLAEARAMECNRCGDCCNGLSDFIKTDSTTGLPLFVWGSKYPEDLYESRYGKRLLEPIGFLDDSNEMPYQGRVGIVDKFEEDENDKPYTCFHCSFHRQDSESHSTCTIRESVNDNPDPKKLEQMRPLNCGDFPVFGTSVDDSLVHGHAFIPGVGSLPRCTWHGIRIVGPYRNEEFWKKRWKAQQLGESVSKLELPRNFVDALVERQRLKKQSQDNERLNS